MKTPEYIRDDYVKYKQGGEKFICKECNTKSASFTYIKIKKPDIISWIFNCTECGYDFALTLLYKAFLGMYLQYNKKGTERIRLFQLFEMFRLGLYYDEVFKHVPDKNDYNQILIRLNKDSTGWRRYWSKIWNN